MAAATALSPTAAHTPRPVEVSHGVVRLGDLADLSRVPANLRERASAAAILVLPPGGQALLTPVQIHTRARQQVPLLANWRPDEGDVVVVRRTTSDKGPVAAPTACVRPRHAIAEGEVLTRQDFTDHPCDTAPAHAGTWRYDQATRALRAERDLSANETLATPPASLLAAARPGQTVRLAVRVGAVAIERNVQTVQTARAGQPVFVKADGRVFVLAAVEPDQ